MSAALALERSHHDLVASYVTALQQAGKESGTSTVQAAKSFCAKLERAGGWTGLDHIGQVDAISNARAFASWLLVFAQLTITADLMGPLDLRLGNAARGYCRESHDWFLAACDRLALAPADVSPQWNALVMARSSPTSWARTRHGMKVNGLLSP